MIPNHLVLLLGLLSTHARPGHAGMMGWLFAGDPPEPTAATAAMVGEDGARQVPFEVRSADDKFLAAVKKTSELELSELDVCQHKIFVSLRQSCSELSEEDMAKVAVQLLNCQSESEARPVFPCTMDMPIAACTRHMDANTWNAYHIVSNRARAVCYAARQQQFRASTELAVNRLAGEAFRQLERMRDLEGSQEELRRLTGDTMERVARGQQELLSRNDQLRAAQASVRSRVVENLRELSRVRSAIGVGQAGVAHTLEEIRAGLESAGAELKLQESARNRSHQQLTADLERIHGSATQLLHRLESVDGATRSVVVRFDALLASLERMNGTIFSLLATLETTQRQVDHKLGWLVELLGSDLHRATGVFLHVGFLLLGMLLLSFLQAPYAVRLALLLVVPANLVSLLQAGPVLEFSAITTLLVSLAVGHGLTCWLLGWFRAEPVSQRAPLPLRPPSAQQKGCSAEVDRAAELSRASTRDALLSSDSEGEERPAPAVSRSGSLLSGLAAAVSRSQRPTEGKLDRSSPLRQRLPRLPEQDIMPPPRSPLLNLSAATAGPESPLNSTLNSTLNGSRLRRAGIGLSPSSGDRPWCAATCRSGLPCRNPASHLSPFCGVHARGYSRESTPVARDSG
ncbi:protein brambleberry-like isoform X2 [Amphibalanus amphitrite]|uniref:protein brambleberry-like isoform X2 n=1 Tax=Amphibalanus amphitrite TaxID=1232801 RepID=UPI001C91FA11|nr:protein brambleberry-like isoform X2 [Amphibalanus amphitrite]XP_043199578.1 protein brambleberry-like isoform X2 [Amphibalanus amphitrite]